MNQRTISILVGVFIVIIIGMFAYSYIKQRELNKNTTEDTPTNTTTETTPYDYITEVDAKHFFIDGKHTLAGQIAMPTPCDLLEANAIVAESNPEQVMVDFTVINNADTCAQVVTPQRFMVSFDASESAVIRARFMGRDIKLNLVPPAEGETPDSFELYIKG